MAGPSLTALEADGHEYFLAGHQFGLELDVTFILLAASLLKETLTFPLQLSVSYELFFTGQAAWGQH